MKRDVAQAKSSRNYLKILAYNLQNFSNSMPIFGISKKNMARNRTTEFEVLQKL